MQQRERRVSRGIHSGGRPEAVWNRQAWSWLRGAGRHIASSWASAATAAGRLKHVWWKHV